MKKILMTTLLLLSASGLASQINVQALEACSLVENDLKRLMCYDKVMSGKQINSNVVIKESKQKTTPASNKVQSKAGQFGLENNKKEAREKLDELHSRVAKLTKNPRGQLRFTLENGQVWKQNGSEHFSVKENDQIIIMRGVFDSFRLKKSGTNRTIQVSRVK